VLAFEGDLVYHWLICEWTRLRRQHSTEAEPVKCEECGHRLTRKEDSVAKRRRSNMLDREYMTRGTTRHSNVLRRENIPRGMAQEIPVIEAVGTQGLTNEERDYKVALREDWDYIFNFKPECKPE
jgi:hypothetical protein